MNNDWLSRYPKAAAMLQRDDDVLEYAPQSCRGLDDTPELTLEEFTARYLSPALAAALRARPQDADAEEIDRGDW